MESPLVENNQDPLIEKNQDPFKLFSNWYSDAIKNEINDPNAMNVATVSSDMQPTSRMIKLINFDENGFVFNTNVESKKSLAIKSNNLIALNFHWKSLRRQVRIEGKAMILTEKEADDIFYDFPYEKQIIVWSSKQSEILPNRKILNKRISDYQEYFNDHQLVRPYNWSGYRVVPKYFEYWWEVESKPFYRLAYKKNKDKWESYDLYP
jgi:pyridoxamine 5'-phosphate oxidase